MKTAAKVFIWIGMIIGFYLIFPIVVGVFALKKIDQNSDLKDIHNFGIITLLFCSFLGGLFMVLIDEKDCDDMSVNSTIVKYETIEITKEEQHSLIGGNIAKTSRVIIYSFAILSVLCLVLGLSLIALFDVYITDEGWSGNTYRVYLYDDGAWLVLFPAVLQIIFGAIPVIIYLYNKQWVSRICNIALICCIPIYTVLYALAIAGACMCYDGVHPIFILIILISFALLMLSIVLVVLNRKVLYTKLKQKVVVSVLELKLSEIARLLDNNIITQSEYDTMREKIISKYC